MTTLGQRIKLLRKERGLTLQALAGEELSKGMLSLIENNKAKPSMESLAYIAGRLNVEQNELLEEVPTTELRMLLDEVEEKRRQAAGSDEEILAGYEAIAKQIHPYIDKLAFRYESGRLLEIYSRCCYHTKCYDWEPAFERAQEIYEQLHLINHVADLYMFRALMQFGQHRYEEALSMLQESRSFIEEQTGSLDPLKRLDFDYYESILYSATGDKTNARRLMEQAIAYSKEQKVFYQIDALYRLASFEAMLDGDISRKDYYIEKLKQFADFSEDSEVAGFADVIEIHYLNSFAHDYEKADQLIETMRLEHSWQNEFYWIEKGKALFGMKRYKEALECFERHQPTRFMNHPYDLSMHYEKYAYVALIYDHLGDLKQATKHAQKAKELIEPMPDLPYKQFILATYEKIVGAE